MGMGYGARCVLYKMDAYRDVQVVGLGQYCETAYNYMDTTTCEREVTGERLLPYAWLAAEWATG